MTPRAVIPAPETPLSEGSVRYHLRTGRHDLTAYDWDRYLDALLATTITAADSPCL